MKYIIAFKNHNKNAVRHMVMRCKGRPQYFTLEEAEAYIAKRTNPHYSYGIYTTNWRHVGGEVIDR